MNPQIQKIQADLRSLFFLNSRDIGPIIGQLETLPDATLKLIAEQIEAAHGKQTEFLRFLVTQNPQFPQELNHFLTASMTAVGHKDQAADAIAAEHILDNL